VRPVEGSLVVNLGVMMQAMSGYAYRSIEHRVVAPLRETECMLLCYFTFPQAPARSRVTGIQLPGVQGAGAEQHQGSLPLKPKI
jgi:isopenicillin N synthase-like dioxygenase